MAADRDLAVALVRAFFPVEGPARTGWEMMGATGVRGLRLLAESGRFGRFVFSEANPEACRVLRGNASRYPGASFVEGDARNVPPLAPFDYVDLDPYGTPQPFVRTALGAVRGGGVVAVTATDMMVLAGAQPGACRERYGANPVRGRLGPEGALRILLAYVSREAESLHRSVRPLLSYVREHYVRCYAEVTDGRTGPDPAGMIDPREWTGPPVGEHGPYGPLWLGPLFDAPLVGLLDVPAGAARPVEVARLLRRLKEEVSVDRPFYYEANVLAKALGLVAPPSLSAIRDGLRRLDYTSARTHARPEGFRTDAPRRVVEELARRLAAPDHSQNARVRA